MRPAIHALAIVAGLAAPIALTFWSTSGSGPRSAAQAAAIAAEAMTPRQVVEAFEALAFDQRKPLEAARKYISPEMRDHSQRIVGDYPSIIAFLEKLDWAKEGGGPQRTIHHLVAEGDIVMVHHHLVRTPGTPGISAVDIFRVKDGKIVEHWEALQDLPATSPNKFGAF